MFVVGGDANRDSEFFPISVAGSLVVYRDPSLSATIHHSSLRPYAAPMPVSRRFGNTPMVDIGCSKGSTDQGGQQVFA